jgi:hypothetical protein
MKKMRAVTFINVSCNDAPMFYCHDINMFLRDQTREDVISMVTSYTSTCITNKYYNKIKNLDNFIEFSPNNRYVVTLDRRYKSCRNSKVDVLEVLT